MRGVISMESKIVVCPHCKKGVRKYRVDLNSTYTVTVHCNCGKSFEVSYGEGKLKVTK
jgi:hypothetical protein